MDYCLLDEQCTIVEKGKISNLSEVLEKLFAHINAQYVKDYPMLTVFENTGIYSNPLARFLHEDGWDYAEVSALESSVPKVFPEARATVLMPGRLHCTA
ncbi:IS110 family transposase [Chryseobacterium lacus]|uniref:IS110 family transposase n=1 Tax=Chryseobacterium lacus TaxID=2058346 RepID=UPI00140DAE38|nr:IS110 family transposase [Chryseobacterium lacus]